MEHLFVFATAFLLIRLLIRLAPQLKLVDIPNERSVHKDIVPRGAGIAIFLALLFACALFEGSLLLRYPLTFTAFALVFIVGVLDDLDDTSPRTKFVIIFVATLLAYFEGIGIFSLGSYFGTELALGWLALPFTLFAVSGFTNALNLIDGLDGLSGLVSVIILSVLFVIGYQHHDTLIVTLSGFLIAALLAFLWFNWQPARIFLGDSGSLTVGFMIAILFVKALDYIHPATVLFLTAVPLLDTIIVMVRRKRHGRSAFEADRTHLHHILLRFFGGNVIRTVIALALMQLTYSLTGMLLMDDVEPALVVSLFAVNTITFYIISSTMLANQERLRKLQQQFQELEAKSAKEG